MAARRRCAGCFAACAPCWWPVEDRRQPQWPTSGALGCLHCSRTLWRPQLRHCLARFSPPLGGGGWAELGAAACGLARAACAQGAAATLPLLHSVPCAVDRAHHKLSAELSRAQPLAADAGREQPWLAIVDSCVCLGWRAGIKVRCFFTEKPSFSHFFTTRLPDSLARRPLPSQRGLQQAGGRPRAARDSKGCVQPRALLPSPPLSEPRQDPPIAPHLRHY
jgi:hypothetical protein